MFINPVDYEFMFDVHASSIVPPAQMVSALAGWPRASPMQAAMRADAVQTAIASARPDEAQRRMAAALKDADAATVLLGNVAMAHPQYSTLKALAGVIATRQWCHAGCADGR